MRVGATSVGIVATRSVSEANLSVDLEETVAVIRGGFAFGRQQGKKEVMSQGTRQHSIPQFYQRRFIADGTGLIWVYQKGIEPRQKSVRNTAMGINFYGFSQNNTVDTQSVEAGLARIDQIGARVMAKLEKGECLAERERLNLAEFISVMWRRTAQHKSEAESKAAQMMPDFFKQHDESWLVRELTKRGVSPGESAIPYKQQKLRLADVRAAYLNQVPDFLFPKNIVRSSMFERVLLAMDWVYFKSTPDTEFLTCDNPVVFNKGTGLKDQNAVIIFPLSRKLLLQAMWISNYRGSYVQLADTQIRTMNRYVVRNSLSEVYASKRSKILQNFVSKWIGSFELAKN